MPLKRLSLKRSRPKTANVQPDLPSKKVRAPRDGVAVVFPIDEGDLPADNFFGVHPQSDSRSAENFKVPSFFYGVDKSGKRKGDRSVGKAVGSSKQTRTIPTGSIRSHVGPLTKDVVLQSMNLDTWELLAYAPPPKTSTLMPDSGTPETKQICEPAETPGDSCSLFPISTKCLMGYRQGWKRIYKQREMPVLIWNATYSLRQKEQVKKELLSEDAGLPTNRTDAMVITRRLNLARAPLIPRRHQSMHTP